MGEERQMKIIVYHGATEIIEAPLNHVGRPRLDFGQGFYVTDLKDQAIKWAKTIAPDFDYASPILDFSIFRGQNRHFCPRLVSFEHQTKA